MEPRATQISTARLVLVQVALVSLFPISGWLVSTRVPGVVPASLAAWWRADLVGVAVPVLWIGGFVLSAWLLATSLLYVWATRRGHERLRRIVGECTAPLVRRVVDAAIVVSIGTAALAAPVSAFAAGPAHVGPPAPTAVRPAPPSTTTPSMTTPSTSGPVPAPAPVIRSGAAGEDPPPSTSVLRRAPATSTTSARRFASVPPVIRAGTPDPSPTSPAPSVPAEPDLRSPVPAPAATTVAVPRPAPTAPAPTAPAPAPAIAVAADHHVVRAGESLWSVAEQQLRAGRPAATVDEVARYWAALVAANRSALRSGNPSLVFPGEVIQLPPIG